jgi:hypothetical protein
MDKADTIEGQGYRRGGADRAAIVLVVVLGLVGGLGFAGYAMHGGDVLTSLIETTMMWCF